MSQQEPTRGFAHRCPLCGEKDVLHVALDDVATLVCSVCGEELDVCHVREILRNWQVILAWLETAPVRE